MAVVLYQGHGSCRLETSDGMVIYIDPYVGEGYDLPADLILVSHEHSDHNQIQLVTQKPTCQILRSGDFLKGGVYLSRTIGNITIKGVEAYNENHLKDACVGFILYVDDRKIYFAGDTSHTQGMSSLSSENLDWAFLPTDGIYNMDTEEASLCAKEIAAKHSVPIHAKPGALFDETVALRFQADNRVILQPGQKQEL